MSLVALSLFGLAPWTLQGILLGLVETFTYELFFGVVFAPIYNAFNVQGSD